MRKLLLATTVATALAAPGAADAAEIYFNVPTGQSSSPQRGFLQVDDRNDATNDITVRSGANGALVFTDVVPFTNRTNANPLDPDSEGDNRDCELSDGGRTATCTPPAGQLVPSLEVGLDDGDDRFAAETAFSRDREGGGLEVYGGAGADTILGSPTADQLVGGPGKDTIDGRDGADEILGDDTSPEPGADNDVLAGGAGGDVLESGPFGTDSVDGGQGSDEVVYRYATSDSVTDATPGVVVTLDASAATTGNGTPGENDTIANVEDVTGTSGADVLTGSTASNVIDGGNGNDRIVGNAGADTLLGRLGADAIDARDATFDRVDCGGATEADTASVDTIDAVDDCAPAAVSANPVPEPAAPTPATVQVPVPVPVPVPATDTTKPTVTALQAPSSVKLRKLRSITASVVSSENGTVTGTLQAPVSGFTIARRVGTVVLAQASGTATAGKRTTVRLKVSKAARKRKLTLLVAVADRSGNVVLRSRSIRLR